MESIIRYISIFVNPCVLIRYHYIGVLPRAEFLHGFQPLDNLPDNLTAAGAYLWHAVIHFPFNVLCGGGRDAAKIAVEPQPSHRDELRVVYSDAASIFHAPKHFICRREMA